MNLNKAIVVGRLTRDPETRTVPSGQTVASFGLATNRVWTAQDGNKQEATDFHNIVAWGRLGEICGRYLTKGSLVLIEGRIQTRSWEGQDGVKRYRTEIVAETMQMGPKSAGAGGGGTGFQASQAPKNSSPREEIPTIEVEETSAPAKEESSSEKDITGAESGKENIKEEDEGINVEDIPF